MTQEALKLALEALEWINRVNAMEYEYQQKARESLNAIYEALAEQKPVQVSPLDFVTMTLEKEHLVGKPIIWAQWPNKEEDDVAQKTNS